MNVNELFTGVLNYIRKHQDGEVVARMSEAGIRYNMNYGVSFYLLKKKAEEIGINHELAKLLWKEDIRETKLLYFLIEDPYLFNEQELDSLVYSFNNHELIEISCLHFFVQSDYALSRAKAWSMSDNESVRMAGFSLLGRVALKRKDLSVEDFRSSLTIFNNLPQNGNLFVKRSISFAMSAIAKTGLHSEIVSLAEQLQSIDSEVAKFVSFEVMEELKYVD